MTSVPYIEVIKVKKKQLESYLVHISDLSHANWKKIQHANFFYGMWENSRIVRSRLPAFGVGVGIKASSILGLILFTYYIEIYLLAQTSLF